MRPIGWRAMNAFFAPSKSPVAFHLSCSDGLSTVPGAIAFTRIPFAV
jgi:hypothetical protein